MLKCLKFAFILIYKTILIDPNHRKEQNAESFVNVSFYSILTIYKSPKVYVH